MAQAASARGVGIDRSVRHLSVSGSKLKGQPIGIEANAAGRNSGRDGGMEGGEPPDVGGEREGGHGRGGGSGEENR